MTMRLASSLLAVALVSCSAPEPARIAVPADTVTVNTTLLETLDAKVVDRQGRLVERAPLAYVGVPDSVLLVGEHGGMQCRTDGVANVILTSGALRSHATVRCNLVRRFGGHDVVCMRVGGPKTPFRVAAYGATGQMMSRPRLYVRNADTTVARLESGMVTALRPGVTDISISSGRYGTGMTVHVVDSARFAASHERC